MTVSPITRPPAGEPRDYEEIANAMDRANKQKSKFQQTMNYDPRFSSFVAWGTGICAILVAGFFIFVGKSLVAMQSDIAVLLARPVGIGQDQYARDFNRVDAEILRLQNDMRLQTERIPR